MPEISKEKQPCEPIKGQDLEKADSWEADQEDRGYYYDDAYGYEVYRSDEDDNEQRDADQADRQKGAVISDDPEI